MYDVYGCTKCITHFKQDHVRKYNSPSNFESYPFDTVLDTIRMYMFYTTGSIVTKRIVHFMVEKEDDEDERGRDGAATGIR